MHVCKQLLGLHLLAQLYRQYRFYPVAHKAPSLELLERLRLPDFDLPRSARPYHIKT